MNLLKLLRSFATGLAGLLYVFRSEQNMWLHGLAAVGVIAGGFAFAIAVWEWVAVVLCIGLVICAECFNTALERLADRVSRETDPLIGRAKDCGSAAVLAAAIASAVVGGVIFGPKIWAAAGW
jgi:diacylglycerol kinase